MKCVQCKGNMTKGTTPVHIDRKGVHLMLDHVPAWICKQCGESLLEEKEVDAVQELLMTIDKKSQSFAQIN